MYFFRVFFYYEGVFINAWNTYLCVNLSLMQFLHRSIPLDYHSESDISAGVLSDRCMTFVLTQPPSDFFYLCRCRRYNWISQYEGKGPSGMMGCFHWGLLRSCGRGFTKWNLLLNSVPHIEYHQNFLGNNFEKWVHAIMEFIPRRLRWEINKRIVIVIKQGLSERSHKIKKYKYVLRQRIYKVMIPKTNTIITYLRIL